MQWLPAIVAGRNAIRLPLGPGTHVRLAAALAADETGTAARSTVVDVLAHDPALVLWAVVQAPCEQPPRSYDALADWFSSAALERFGRGDATRDATGDAPGPTDEDRARCAQAATLAGRSLAVAAIAQEFAAQHEVDRQAAHLLGMLHLADAWFSLGSSRPESPQQLPAWLRGELDRVQAGDPTTVTSPAGCVRAAVRAVESGGAADGLPAGFQFDGQLVDDTARAALDDWTAPVPANLLGNLTAKLHRLRELEEQFAERLEAEKLASLKELAYGAGHEINNPLANISARAQALLADERDVERRRMLASINAQAFRAHEMIADMMLFARPPRTEPQPLDLVELLGTLQGELGEQAAAQQTQIVLHAPHVPVRIVADKTQIAVALRALCVNALEALVTGGRLEISLAAAIPPDNGVRITVADDGPGIPAKVRPHVFDPFYSGREAGRGLGLGLSKCWRIVTMHHGRVDVDSPEGRGAVFTVTLPAGDTA